MVGSYAYSSCCVQYGFLDSGGVYTSLNVPPVYDQAAYGINDKGQIVGFYISNGDPSYTQHGFLDNGGVFSSIDYPGASETLAHGINNNGQIVGYWISGQYHGFLDNGGVLSSIDFPGATQTAAEGINNGGDIVGYYLDASGKTHGFLASLAGAKLTPTTLSFGNQPLGTTSSPKKVTLTSNGTANLIITRIQVIGDFALTTNCPGTLLPSVKCTINVTFKPTATGKRVATLSVTDNAADSPQTTSLTGTGIGRPSVAISSVTKSKSGDTLSLTVGVTNDGTGDGQNLILKQVGVTTLAGSGSVTLTSPALPAALGNLAQGAITSFTLTFNVPSTVTKFRVTASGTIQDVAGDTFTYSIGTVVYP